MKKIINKATFLFLISLLAVFSANATVNKVKSIDEIKENAIKGINFISNKALKDRITINEKLVLLDVRTQKEFEAGHLKGAAWVERGIAEFVLARTLPDKEAEIIVYCKKGYRAALVVKTLRDVGYQNVQAHAGFDEWVEAGNVYINYLGESKLVKAIPINAANFGQDYYQDKQ